MFISPIIRQALVSMREDKTHRLGAALAYYSLFSLVPLLLFLLFIFGELLSQPDVQLGVLNSVGQYFGAPVKELLSAVLANIQSVKIEGVYGLIILGVLLFSATGAFRHLKESMNIIWHISEVPRFSLFTTIYKNSLALFMIFFTGLLMLVSMSFTVIFSSVLEQGLLSFRVFEAINFLFTLSITSVVFALMFSSLPDKTLSFKRMFVPGFITALLFVLVKIPFGIYLGLSTINTTFGAAGSLVVFLLWIYISAQIFLFGAELSRAYYLSRK